MTDIHIPPEALEAGARAVALENGHDIDYYSDRLREHCFAQARAAFTAALNAWPGMTNYVGYEGDELVQIITLSAKVQ